NVGVIAVAIFEEEAPAQDQIIVTEGTRRYDYRDDLDASAPRHGAPGRVANVDRSRGHAEKSAKKMRPPMPADEAPSAPTSTSSVGGGGASAAPPPPRRERMEDTADDNYGGDYGGEVEQSAPRTNRLGLGTEFGGSR